MCCFSSLIFRIHHAVILRPVITKGLVEKISLIKLCAKFSSSLFQNIYKICMCTNIMHIILTEIHKGIKNVPLYPCKYGIQKVLVFRDIATL